MSQGNYKGISIRYAMDKINDEELDSFDWVEILSSHPEFADKCNWDVFSCGGYHDLRLLLGAGGVPVASARGRPQRAEGRHQ